MRHLAAGRLGLPVVTLVMMVAGIAPGCRLLGAGGPLVCTTDDECDAGDICKDGHCANAPAAEGEGGEGEGVAAEGEGAGEGEGAAGEGEGEGEGAAAGEGEGATAGEGEGAAGEGEGEGEGLPGTLVFNFQPTLNVAVPNDLGVAAPAFAFTADDCLASQCQAVAAPDRRTGAASVVDPARDEETVAMPSAALMFEAVVDLPTAAGPIFSIDAGTNGTVSAVITNDVSAGTVLVVTVGKASVVRHLGTASRGWAHLFCTMDDGATDSVEQLQCYLNAERFTVEPVVPASFQPTTDPTVLVNVPFLQLAVWDRNAYLQVHGDVADVLSAQDAVHAFVRGRLAQWSGVPFSAGITPLFVDGGDDNGAELGLGAVSVPMSIAADDVTALVWLMPGWPRVVRIASAGTGALLVEGERRNILDPAVFAQHAPTGCTTTPGPSGSADGPRDGLRCLGSGHSGSIPLTQNLSTRVASVMAIPTDAATGSVTLGNCVFRFNGTNISCTNGSTGTSTAFGQGWSLLTSTIGVGTTSITAAATNAVIAYPQVEVGRATSAMPLGGFAAPDVVEYPLAAQPAQAGIEIIAQVERISDDSFSAVATVGNDRSPTSDAQLFVDAGDMIFSCSTCGVTNPSSPVVDDTRYDALLEAGSTCGSGCEPLQQLATPAPSGMSLFTVGGPVSREYIPNGNGTNQMIIRNVQLIAVPSQGTLPSVSTIAVAYTAGARDTAVDPGLSQGAPVMTFDAEKPTAAPTTWAGCATDPSIQTDAPTAPNASKAFLTTAACPSYVTSSVALPLAGEPLLMDAFFEVSGVAGDEVVASFHDRGGVGLDITTVASVSNPRFTDGNVTYSLSPTNGVGYDGWMYVACSSQPPAIPVCTVNLEPAVVTLTSDHINTAAEGVIGEDGGNIHRDRGGIMFVHAWAPATVSLTTQQATVTRMAAQFFGVGASGVAAPDFTRDTSAMVSSKSSAGYFSLLKVARGWPRLQSITVTDAPGYLSEPARTNYIARSNNFSANAWTASGSIGLATVPGPRPSVETLHLTSTETIRQVLSSQRADQLFSEAPDPTNDFPVAFSMYFTNGAPTMTITSDGASGGATSTVSATAVSGALTCSGTTAGALCEVQNVDDGDAGWERFTLYARIPKLSTDVTVILDAGVSVGVDIAAPQLEVGNEQTSYIPTDLVPVDRAADALSYSLRGPIAYAGSMHVTATVPTHVVDDHLFASLQGPDGVLRPTFAWENGKLFFPDPSEEAADAVSITTNHRVDVDGAWRHGLTQLTANGLGPAAVHVFNAAPDLSQVPVVNLIVGGVGAVSESGYRCGTCSVGSTIDAVSVTLTPGIP